MTNDEIRMSNEIRMNEYRTEDGVASRSFDIRASTFIRHSDFEIRHSEPFTRDVATKAKSPPWLSPGRASISSQTSRSC
jgi:hypothetical protein